MDAIEKSGTLSLNPIRYTQTSDREMAQYELKKDDFLFNTRNSRELVGKSALFDGDKGFVYNNNILRVRFSDYVLPQYVLSYFQTKLAKRELEARKAGTTSVFAIYQKSLSDLAIVVPPMPLQEGFASRVNAIRTWKKQLIKDLHLSSDLFASLQHRAFTGQF